VRPGVLLAGAAAAVLVAGAAVAQMPETPPGKWWKRPRVVALLKLSPEQQDKLEEIFARNRRSFVDLKADVEKNQIDVEELVAKKDADPKKVSAALDSLEQARGKLRKSMAMMFIEQRTVLTQQQWSMILERRDEWRRERQEERRRNEMERRGELPPPEPAPAMPRTGSPAKPE